MLGNAQLCVVALVVCMASQFLQEDCRLQGSDFHVLMSPPGLCCTPSLEELAFGFRLYCLLRRPQGVAILYEGGQGELVLVWEAL